MPILNEHFLSLAAALGCATVLASCARPAATPVTRPEIQRRLLATRPADNAPGQDTQLWLIEYPPGAEAPPHRHPVVGVGYVVEGAFESAFAGEPLVRVQAGESFVDPARVEHRVFRNAHADRPLKFVVAYTIDKATPVVQLAGGAGLQLQAAAPALSVEEPALYPETLELDPLTGQFLAGSVRHGAVYRIDAAGRASKLVDDPRLVSVLGIAADAHAKRLWVTSSDLGVSVKASPEGRKRHAAVGVYDLTSGRALHFVDLTAVAPPGEHLINGIALDGQGNAYATDSFAGAIYKLDAQGQASVLVQHEAFRGPGINLNGLVYHPDGYLLTVNKRTGQLYRIPLRDPSQLAAVRCDATLIGGDGLVLTGPERLLVIANKTPDAASNAAFELKSDDGWQSAALSSTLPLGDTYPTTAAVRGNELFVLSSQLDAWLGADDAKRAVLVSEGRRAEIRAIGRLTPDADALDRGQRASAH